MSKKKPKKTDGKNVAAILRQADSTIRRQSGTIAQLRKSQPAAEVAAIKKHYKAGYTDALAAAQPGPQPAGPPLVHTGWLGARESAEWKMAGDLPPERHYDPAIREAGPLDAYLDRAYDEEAQIQKWLGPMALPFQGEQRKLHEIQGHQVQRRLLVPAGVPDRRLGPLADRSRSY